MSIHVSLKILHIFDKRVKEIFADPIMKVANLSLSQMVHNYGEPRSGSGSIVPIFVY